MQHKNRVSPRRLILWVCLLVILHPVFTIGIQQVVAAILIAFFQKVLIIILLINFSTSWDRNSKMNQCHPLLRSAVLRMLILCVCATKHHLIAQRDTSPLSIRQTVRDPNGVEGYCVLLYLNVMQESESAISSLLNSINAIFRPNICLLY